MNKKLIAVAIAAAMAAPAAFADTTLYGKMHLSVGKDGSSDHFEVKSHASRVGIQGSEDLGNGLKAIFKWENGINPDENTGIANGRNAYVGVAGDFGTFLVGRHDTPDKVAFYAAGNDHLGDSIIDLNTMGAFEETRIDNAIAYISPSFSGVTFAAAIVPGESGGATNAATAAGTGATTADGLADAYSIGLLYSGMGLKAGLGYMNAEDYYGVGTGELVNAGASYTFGDFTVGGQYQGQEVNGTEATIWALSGKANFGNNALILKYTNTDDDTNEVDAWGVALEHTMSKRTSVYVAFAAFDDNTVARPVLSATATQGTPTDTDFALGMIHNF